MIEPLTEEKLAALLGPNPTQVSSSTGVINGNNEVNKNDVIAGVGGNYILQGLSGNDFIYAGSLVEVDSAYYTRYGDYEEGASIDDDKLYGGEGNDVLVGGRGNDILGTYIQ